LIGKITNIIEERIVPKEDAEKASKELIKTPRKDYPQN